MREHSVDLNELTNGFNEKFVIHTYRDYTVTAIVSIYNNKISGEFNIYKNGELIDTRNELTTLLVTHNIPYHICY